MFKSKDLATVSKEFVELACEVGKKQYLIHIYQKEIKEIAHKMEKLSRSAHYEVQKQQKKIKNNPTTSEVANETV